MSGLMGAYYEVDFQVRPLTVVTISNQEQDVLIGEKTGTFFGIQDYVSRDDADRLKGIWIKSLHETRRIPFQDLSADATSEEVVLRAAAIASKRIDLAMEHRRVAEMDMAVPSHFAVDLHPTDGMLRQETLETLVPFQRIRSLLMQREQDMGQEPLGRIAFCATRIETPEPGAYN